MIRNPYKLIATLLLLMVGGSSAQITFGGKSVSTSIVGTIVADSSGWRRIGTNIRLRTLTDKVIVGTATSDVTAGIVVTSGGLAIADATTNASVGSLSVAGSAFNIASGRSGSGTYLPMTFYSNAFERGRFTTGGSLLLGLTSTEATDQSGYLYADGGVNVVNSEGINGSLLGLSLGGGTANVSSGRTSAGGSFLPLAFYTSGSEQARIDTTDGDLLVGLTSSDEAFADNSIISNASVASLTATTNASYISMGNVLGDISFIEAGRTGSGTRLPLAIYTGGSERGRVTTNGSLLWNLQSTESTDAAGQFYASGGVNVTSAATNSSLIGLSLGGGTANLSSGRTSAGGSYLPLAFFTSALEKVRISLNGSILSGLTSIEATDTTGNIYARRGIHVADSSADGSMISMTVSSTSNLVAGRTGAGGTFLPLAFWTSANQRATIDEDGGLYMAGATGSSQGSGTINATGLYVNGVAVAAGGATDIGDTTEVDLFWALDTTAANTSDLVLTALSSRRSVQYWSFDADNSDTLLFSIPIPAFIDSLEYVVPIFIANTNSGNYLFRLKWEFTADDAAFDNSLTMTNSTDITVAAPSASGDIRYARTSLVGSATDAGSNRWMDGMLIRVGGDGGDTATGNADLIGFMAGWSRSK